MEILVSGGAGYIGSHTCIALIEAGYSVVVVDNLTNSKRDSIETIKTITSHDIPFYEIDVTNKQAVEHIFKNHKIQGVIHCAGLKAVGESVEKPLTYYENNIVSTLVLANCCLKFGVNQFVFSSSATVYGENEVPFVETMDVLPTTNPYGETKAICERILNDIVRANSLFSVSILRYFNPVGAHESGLIGEAPNGTPNNLMPYITQVAKRRHQFLSIFGNDYPTLDGTGVRDYIHVMDLAEGHVAALSRIRKGIQIYNLGTGQGTSVLELVKAFEVANGVCIPFKIVDRRPGDIAACYADVQKANRELEWIARRDVKKMCEDAWKFEQNYNHQVV
ncbi:UDP-glucose 4-epimerase [Solibacillus isronensis B3W22]|uniref:UDP-glucose 4-epimerase n=1 Tax=Solibacillus isronensis B3W22 TaxID=1224748 RepID=K1LRL8_9BACL|nr:UDP-glucose 4-epimerase GalE [Solibacillus isronensis]AMO84776.1 UDP-glucose 4-epimerase GalE [Solibacillus silvestris]EKB46784.1 UDP-glucose 4-epimerase [Solibacillus isronensis B3W22]